MIRKATIQDVQRIQTLLHDTWKDTYGQYLPQTVLDEVYANWQSLELLTMQVQDDNLFFPVAVEDNEIVGLATAQTRDGVTIVGRLYVDPVQQRKGIGEKLLQSVISNFPENKKLRLHVEEMNQKGKSFYAKHGFTEVMREQGKIGTTVIDQIVLEKVIGRNEL
jgi:ribosomal protein S18 acetylase RimI-like enzyme